MWEDIGLRIAKAITKKNDMRGMTQPNDKSHHSNQDSMVEGQTQIYMTK